MAGGVDGWKVEGSEDGRMEGNGRIEWKGGGRSNYPAYTGPTFVFCPD